MKKNHRVLSMTRETLRTLVSSELSAAGGGLELSVGDSKIVKVSETVQRDQGGTLTGPRPSVSTLPASCNLFQCMIAP